LFAAAYAVVNLAYLGIGALGFWRWRRAEFLGMPELAWAMAASVVLRCVLLLTIDNSEPRYTLEFFPVVFVCAGALFGIGRVRSSAATSAETVAARSE
jgi:hypothetical protein